MPTLCRSTVLPRCPRWWSWWLLVGMVLLGLGAGTMWSDEQEGVTIYTDPANTGSSNIDPSGITLGPDGRIWMPWTDSTLVALSTTGAFVHYPMPVDPQGIAAGTHNDLWAVEPTEIDHVTTTGSILGRYSISNTDTYYSTVILGPDGNLWMGMYNDDIGRFSTTTHTITHFPLANPNAYVIGLANGSDGAVWATCLTDDGSPDEVVRISTTGSMMSWDFPDEQTMGGICAGPDGALWFCEGDTGAIGRISTSGSITTHLTSPGVSPSFVTVGADGGIWFTESDGAALGRITTGEFLTEYQLPSSVPYQIVSGSDGRLWFLDYDTTAIYAAQTADVVRISGSSTGGTTSGAAAHISTGSDGSGTGCGLGGGMAGILAALLLARSRGIRQRRTASVR